MELYQNATALNGPASKKWTIIVADKEGQVKLISITRNVFSASFQILSIFAFATTTSVHTRLEFVIACTSNTTQASTTVPINVGYPFEYV